jgi:hypothetical protein
MMRFESVNGTMIPHLRGHATVAIKCPRLAFDPLCVSVQHLFRQHVYNSTKEQDIPGRDWPDPYEQYQVFTCIFREAEDAQPPAY